MDQTLSNILRLKKERNAVILAHYYEDGEIQDVADYIGDSFYLSQMGQKVKADVILLAGVVFMAESVKILNPTKTVLVPDLNAGCSLVDGAPYESYLEWRKKYPHGIAVTYINSSSEVKAISDVIVTSSNAQKIIEAIPADRPILFGPDQHLGRFLSKKLNRDFVLWPGACQVHILFNARRLHEMKLEHPDAVVLAHPECEQEVLAFADVVGSTSRLLEEVQKSSAKKFIVATETGIFHQMKKARPEVELLQAPVEDKSCACNNCPYMKLNTLQKIEKALATLSPKIELSETLRLKARLGLDRMLAISRGETVSWPDAFVSN